MPMPSPRRFPPPWTVEGFIVVPESPARMAEKQNRPSRAEVTLKKDGGIFVVPVEINGTITLDFAIDSGAADVSVPADVFLTLKRAGTIKDSDIIGEQTYVLADGSKSQSVTFTIRSLKVGDKVIENVRASVASVQGTLLLGQSFLERFKSWSLDNNKHELLLELQ
jgi:clan AA aspartic protease (TIGR02281 family)